MLARVQSADAVGWLHIGGKRTVPQSGHVNQIGI